MIFIEAFSCSNRITQIIPRIVSALNTNVCEGFTAYNIETQLTFDPGSGVAILVVFILQVHQSRK